MAEFGVSGPLFDGRAEDAIDDFLDDAREIIAARGVNYWSENLDRSIRHPTPYYETQVTVQNVAADLTVIHDRKIVYGPWLEDGGSRSSVFPGYHSLARAYRKLEQDVPQLIAGAQARMVARLNGGS